MANIQLQRQWDLRTDAACRSMCKMLQWPCSDIGRHMDRNEKVFLIADDDAAVCNLVKKLLERRGYRALTAANGREALEIFRSTPTRVAAVISDVEMPEMDGVELQRQLMADCPGLHVLMMSGKVAGVEGRAFLAKPFAASDLYRAVETLVAE